MFNTTRYFYPHGLESDSMECTYKEFTTFEKALQYAERYATGRRFAGVTIDDDDGNTLYEITSDFEDFDYRQQEAI